MREERILLEDRVQLAAVRRKACDILTVKNHLAAVRGREAAEDAERRGLAATGGAEQGHKGVLRNGQIQVVQHHFSVEGLGDVLQIHQC